MTTTKETRMESAVKKKPAEAGEQKLIVVEERTRKESPALPSTQPGNLMQALAAAAANPQMDVAKVKELFAMHKEIAEREAAMAYADAMARAQAEIQPVAARAFNTHTASSYAKLEAIDKAITPIHTKYGLSISYDTETKNDADPIPEGYLRIVATVRHSGGHKERHHIDLPPDAAGSQGKTNKTMVQAIGSTNTYGRRYLKLMIFNVSTYDDRDGNGARSSKGGALDESALADHLAAIDGAGKEDLMKVFGAAWNAAEKVKDKEAQQQFIEHRDARKKALGIRS